MRGSKEVRQEMAGRVGDFLRLAEDSEKGREDLKRAGMGVTQGRREWL